LAQFSSSEKQTESFMSLCVFIAGKVSSCLTGLLFSLSWTHSVEKTQWIEHWAIKENNLVLQEVFVKGSGAGIDPAPNAILDHGWYRWKPMQAVILPSISMANSELTPDNWMLCQLNFNSEPTSECLNFSEFENQGIQLFTLKPCLPP
jgi:hypothetical protein